MTMNVSIESDLKRLRRGLRDLEKQAVPKATVRTLNRVIGVIDELEMQDGAGNPLVHVDEFNYSMYPEQGRLVRSISKHLRQVPMEQMRMAVLANASMCYEGRYEKEQIKLA